MSNVKKLRPIPKKPEPSNSMPQSNPYIIPEDEAIAALEISFIINNLVRNRGYNPLFYLDGTLTPDVLPSIWQLV